MPGPEQRPNVPDADYVSPDHLRMELDPDRRDAATIVKASGEEGSEELAARLMRSGAKSREGWSSSGPTKAERFVTPTDFAAEVRTYGEEQFRKLIEDNQYLAEDGISSEHVSQMRAELDKAIGAAAAGYSGAATVEGFGEGEKTVTDTSSEPLDDVAIRNLIGETKSLLLGIIEGWKNEAFRARSDKREFEIKPVDGQKITEKISKRVSDAYEIYLDKFPGTEDRSREDYNRSHSSEQDEAA